MSDRGGYKEPKAGDWMLVVERGSGVVDCLKVADTGEAVANPSPVAALSDGSLWGVETGLPLHKRWRDHYLWPIDRADDVQEAMTLLVDASPEAVAEVYGILLRDKRARDLPRST